MAEDGGTWITGIQINSTAEHQVHHVSVTGNSVRGAAEGIRFGGTTFQQTPVCALNRIDTGVTSPLLGINNLPEDSLVVSGAASIGGAAANLVPVALFRDWATLKARSLATSAIFSSALTYPNLAKNRRRISISRLRAIGLALAGRRNKLAPYYAKIPDHN